MATYYVQDPAYNVNASDSNAGTDIALPWATWTKGFASAVAGDTVYFRGGTYYTTSQVSASVSGSIGNLINYYNYPGEVPVLDGINKVSPSSGLVCTTGTSYIHIKGLTVCNNKQIIVDYRFASGIVLYEDCDKVTLEQCTSHDNGVRGFWFRGVKTVYVTNCDSYNNADTLTASPYTGNNGDGFIVSSEDNTTDGHIVFTGCRSWYNSDDGWDVSHEGYVEINNCWSWLNGYLEAGNGCGFKLTLSSNIIIPLSRKLINSISTYNKFVGITTNDNNNTAVVMNIYNNTCYKNTSYGFYIFNTISTDEEELAREFINNISYDNTAGSIGYNTGALYTHNNNSWDIPLTLTDNDFESLDYTQLYTARKVDGSLPDITFGKLKEGSSCIGAGVNVGLSTDGAGTAWKSTPSIGAFEYIGADMSIYRVKINRYYPFTIVQIGSQTWMERSYDFKTSLYPNGSEDNVNEYGGLYSKAEANAISSLFPGWHIPSYDEAQILHTFLGGNSVAGGHMKEIGTNYWSSPNLGADNISGFKAKGSGWYWVDIASYRDFNENFIFWTSDIAGANETAITLSYDSAGITQFQMPIGTAYCSIRLIQDAQPIPEIRIGTQIWSRYNYNVLGTYPDNDIDNVNDYGTLLTWDQAMAINVPGWHLPTQNEFLTLRAYVGATTGAGKLMEIGTTYWDGLTHTPTNETGFGARGAGYGGSFFKEQIHFWCTYEVDATNAIAFILYNNYQSIAYGSQTKSVQRSVRLVKD